VLAFCVTVLGCSVLARIMLWSLGGIRVHSACAAPVSSQPSVCTVVLAVSAVITLCDCFHSLDDVLGLTWQVLVHCCSP
jgi:hypothetical protein